MINNWTKTFHQADSKKASTVNVMANDIRGRSRAPSAAAGDDHHAPNEEVVVAHIPSKRVFGIGIIAIGLLVLSIALILGFQFPIHVFEKTIDHLCVLSSAHPEYRIWVNDSYRNNINRVFYWNLTNLHSFLAGQAPQFQEVGPYVYRQQNYKFGVHFKGATVKYHDAATQEYDEAMTRSQCPTCGKYDQITVFNQAYLQNVGRCGGLQNYLMWQLPSLIKEILQEKLDIHSEDYVYSELGKLGRSFIDSDYANTFPPNFDHFGFGGFLQASHVDSDLLRNFTQGFSAATMQGLYQAMMQRPECTIWSSNTSCQQSLRSNGPANETLLLCTFYECLKYSQDYYTGDKELASASICLAKHVCQNESSCFDLSNTNISVTVPLLYSFIFEHLIVYVNHMTFVLTDNGIAVTRPQHSIAIGYRQNNTYWQQDKLHVPGVLHHVDWTVSIPSQSPLVKLSNCYAAVDAAANFHWRAYKGHRTVPASYFPSTSSSDRHVASPYLNFAPSTTLGACAFYGTGKERFDMFLPPFLRRMPFYASKNTSYRGVTVERFLLNSSALAVDFAFVFHEGLQDMQGSEGYCSWRSLPHFLFSEETRNSFYPNLMKPRSSKHSSSFDVEGITGEVWRRSTRYQHNIGLPQSYTHFNSSSPSSTCTVPPYPVYWVDQESSYNDKGMKQYNHQVRRLMNASCGGLIGVGIISGIIIVLGVLAATVRWRSGRIVPIKDDSF